jgi:hypothetical protein
VPRHEVVYRSSLLQDGPRRRHGGVMFVVVMFEDIRGVLEVFDQPVGAFARRRVHPGVLDGSLEAVLEPVGTLLDALYYAFCLIVAQLLRSRRHGKCQEQRKSKPEYRQ